MRFFFLILFFSFCSSTTIAKQHESIYRGILHKSKRGNILTLETIVYKQNLILSDSGKFHAGDTVTVKGFRIADKSHKRTNRFHVTEISEINCCTSAFNGDIDGDGQVDISDLVLFFSWMQLDYPPIICHDQLDLNGDSLVNDDDIEYLVNYMFREGLYPVDCEN